MNTITIVHFNDVYNIEPGTQEPVGGAARFVTALRQLAHLNPLVLFSGDALSPSLMSTVTRGHHMIPVLNTIGVHCALYGNHDFDFGVDNLVKVAEKTNFPWLLSNVYDTISGNPLADGQTTHVIECCGKKIGIVGLIEEEWIATLATLDPEDLIYLDFVNEGRRIAQDLRDQGADCVIALTHMRWPNDVKLAENVDEIDIILGGHDHDFGAKTVNGKLVLKSGTDFRSFSVVTLTFQADGAVSADYRKCHVDSSIAEDDEIRTIVDDYHRILGSKLDSVLGQIDVDLDGRFESIRRSETNLGNFVTNIMLEATDADLVLLNSGSFRSDRIHPRGDFRLRDLVAILPVVENLVVIEVSGSKIIDALENGVSKYPALEGRFPQVAGVSFAFNPNRPPGERIVRGSVRVQNQPIIDVKLYRLCTKGYLASGKDGYDSLIGARVIVNEDDGPVVSTIVQNHFKSVKILLGERKAKYSHRPSIRSLNRSKSVEPPSFIRNATDDCVPEEDDENDCDAFRDGTLKERIAQLSMSPNARRLHRRRTMSYGLNSMRRQFSLQESIDYNDIRSSLVPTVDDRIRVVVE